jgi:hypothetical protein
MERPKLCCKVVEKMGAEAERQAFEAGNNSESVRKEVCSE